MDGVEGPAMDVGEDFAEVEDEDANAGGRGGGAVSSRGVQGTMGVAR